jgi:hypothetical protein
MEVVAAHSAAFHWINKQVIGVLGQQTMCHHCNGVLETRP